MEVDDLLQIPTSSGWQAYCHDFTFWLISAELQTTASGGIYVAQTANFLCDWTSSARRMSLFRSAREYDPSKLRAGFVEETLGRLCRIDFHAHQRVAGRRPGFLQKTWARRHRGFYRQRIGDLTGIARRRGQGRFHQRRPHGGRHRCRRRHGDFGWNDPYTSLSALGDAPDTPARGFERQESRHQHLRFRQPSGGRSGAAAARPGYGARQNRDLAGGNAAGASRGPGHRQNRGDAFGAWFWPGRARTRDSR